MEIAERERGLSAQVAAKMIEPGMRIGLGTGRTVCDFLGRLASNVPPGIECVATSEWTERVARRLDLPVRSFDAVSELDISVDGADQVSPDGWLVKGSHGAHLREKIVATAAKRSVIIISSEKLVFALGPPVPLELVRFGLAATLRVLAEAELIAAAERSPDGGVLARFMRAVSDPAALAAELDACPGVTAHGLFPPGLTQTVVVAGRAYALEDLALAWSRRSAHT